MSKYIKTDYWVEVWSNGHYVEWGVAYPNKEKALNCIKTYLEDISPSSDLGEYKYYQQQYKDYTSHPIKLCSRKQETIVYPVEKQEIDI